MCKVVACAGKDDVTATAGINRIIACTGLDIVMTTTQRTVCQIDVVGIDDDLIDRGRSISQNPIVAAVRADHIVATPANDNVVARTSC